MKKFTSDYINFKAESVLKTSTDFALQIGKFIRAALDLITTDNFGRGSQNNGANAKLKKECKINVQQTG